MSLAFSPDEELDPMEVLNQDEELEEAGMHLLGGDADEDEAIVEGPAVLLKDDEADAIVKAAEEDEEKIKDGLAELEEMEKAYLNEDTEEAAIEEEEV